MQGDVALVWREYTVLRSNPNAKLVCALKFEVTTNLAGPPPIAVLIPSKHNLQHFSWELTGRGFNQHASRILELEQLVAEEAERIPSCGEDFHSPEEPCESNEQHGPNFSTVK